MHPKAGARLIGSLAGWMKEQQKDLGNYAYAADMRSVDESGALDLMSTSGVNQTVVAVGGINAIAFAFPFYDKVWVAMDGELGNLCGLGSRRSGCS